MQMCYIYQADVYCEECGKAIRAKLKKKGLSPKNPKDEYTYDSDDYPKGPYEVSESDVVEHCGSGADCLEPHVFSSGYTAGKFLENPLTNYGVQHLISMIKEGGEVVEMWAEFYREEIQNAN